MSGFPLGCLDLFLTVAFQPHFALCDPKRFRSRGRHRVPAGLLTGLVLCLSGCDSSEGPTRISVEGQVEQNGVPVASGSIGFLPADGHQGPAANAEIADGAYAFTSANGPTAGPHQVVIRIHRSKAEVMNSPDRPRDPWKFSVTVPEEGPWEKDFDLQSESAK